MLQLLGILCQSLVPKATGQGRVAAVEVMLANAAVKNLVREGKTYQLPNTIRMNTQHGMELLDQALVRLYRKGLIDIDRVFDFCNDPEEVGKLTGERDERERERERERDRKDPNRVYTPQVNESESEPSGYIRR